MARSKLTIIIVMVSSALLLLGIPLVISHHFMGFSLLFMGATLIPFFIRFEKKKVMGRELVILSVLAAIAAVSRIPFASIPSVQPTTFVIIVTGLVFGAESGFVVGCLAALVSNLFLGQGPWTPWQMYAWGLIGGAAGLLRSLKWMSTLWFRCVFGAVSGYFFGWLMNLWYILSLPSINWATLLTFYSTSFYFDSAHALSNVVFLALFSSSWIKVLGRFKRKYGLLEER